MVVTIPMILPVVIPGMMTVSLLSLIYCMKPEKRRSKRLADFEKYYIAHRGFHDNEGGCPENSLLAFERAAELGYGIELDVQLTKDKVPVVFHDWDLKRAADMDRKIRDCTFEELKKVHLFGTEEHIPSLPEVLKVLEGRVPLVIEIKVKWKVREACGIVAQCLDSYEGLYCMESFSPLAVRWFKRKRPSVLRGQLATNHRGERLKTPWPVGTVLTNCLLNAWSGPDFIAYNCQFSKSLTVRLLRRLHKCKMAAWTIKSQKDLEQQKNTFDLFIFDSFQPENRENGCSETSGERNRSFPA